MAYQDIPEKQDFTTEIHKVETEDPVHADLMNDIISKLLTNEVFLKNNKAAKESPEFTGEPEAPTPPQSSNDGRVATTAFVKAAVAALVDGAPETLDTLKEIADALAENETVVSALDAAIGNKADNIQTFTKASNLVNIVSGETFKTILGKIAKAIADFISHKAIYGDTVVSMGRKSGTNVKEKSFAFGNDVEASGGYSAVALGGGDNTASGYCGSAVIGGSGNTASGNYGSVVIGGGSNKSTGSYGSAALGGRYNTASGELSAALGGVKNIASNYASISTGKFSKNMQTGGSYNNQVGDAFVIGNGTSDILFNDNNTARSNALRVTYLGDILGTKAFQSSGADYAEFVKPWADGNPDSEDRVGYFVTVKDGLLHKANESDYIIGITSGNPSVVGNADEDYYWRYERDVFNRIVMEDVSEMAQQTDDGGNPVFDEDTHEPVMAETGNMVKNARMKLADGYDPSKQESYVPRADRPEWDYVGMVGVIPVRDDGTCVPGQFCKCGGGGIATLAVQRGLDTYMVLERIAGNVISVIVK